jgi:hypothetical protein
MLTTAQFTLHADLVHREKQLAFAMPAIMVTVKHAVLLTCVSLTMVVAIHHQVSV